MSWKGNEGDKDSGGGGGLELLRDVGRCDLGRGHTSVECTCAQRTSFPTDAGYQFRRALLYCLTVFKMHVIQVVWPFYLVLRIIKKMNRSRRCGYIQLTVNVYIYSWPMLHIISPSQRRQ
jgi:hypothetical protein